jgi:hypothetical protein
VCNRRIDLVQYSIDDSPFRRLCNGWIGDFHKVTHIPNGTDEGTPLTAGTYNIRIRYKVDHDYIYSGASAGVPVTVS